MNLTLGRSHNPREWMVSPVTFSNLEKNPHSPVSLGVGFQKPLAFDFKAPRVVPKPGFSAHRTSNSCALASNSFIPQLIWGSYD